MEEEHSVLQKLTALHGWVGKFARRHALLSVALHGKEGQFQVLTV